MRFIMTEKLDAIFRPVSPHQLLINKREWVLKMTVDELQNYYIKEVEEYNNKLKDVYIECFKEVCGYLKTDLEKNDEPAEFFNTLRLLSIRQKLLNELFNRYSQLKIKII